MLNKILIILLFVFFIPAAYSQENDITVSHVIVKGGIQINIEGKYSESVEFYEGHYDSNDLNYIDPIDKVRGNSLLNCNNGNCETILFDSVNIIKPGNYYFVVRDLEQNPVRINFVLTFNDLSSCDYNGVAVKNNACVNSYTNKDEDKSLYCRNKEIIFSCTGPGFCGCPTTSQICCTNENLEECKGKIGSCVFPGEKRFEKEVEIEGKIIKQELKDLGCVFPGNFNVPEGICANNVVPGLLGDPGNKLFGYACECNEISEDEIDKDGDGYDPISLGGTDCRDGINPEGCPVSSSECDLSGNKNHASCPVCINPGMIESCGLKLGNNNIDEDCDGRDLDCSFNCDSDGDGFLDSTSFTCRTIAKLTNKQVEVNDNNAKVNPLQIEICDGIDNNQNGLIDEDLENCASKNVNDVLKISEIKSRPEICGDKIDNNGNGEVDESSCNCVDGQSEILKGICSNGEKICRNGKWAVSVEPVNSCSPLIFVDGFDGKNNAIGISRDSKIIVSSTFICRDEECNNIEVSI